MFAIVWIFYPITGGILTEINGFMRNSRASCCSMSPNDLSDVSLGSPLRRLENSCLSDLPTEGIEPTRPCGHWILSPARLPIPPRRLEMKRELVIRLEGNASANDLRIMPGTTAHRPSLHRSQIFREFVSDAGAGSSILRLRRTFLLLFGRKNLKQFVSLKLF